MKLMQEITKCIYGSRLLYKLQGHLHGNAWFLCISKQIAKSHAVFAIYLYCVGEEVCTVLCSNAYLSPKASSRFGMRIGPLPLPVLAERLRPKPGGMSDSPGASRAPTPPQLAEPCVSTPCLVLVHVYITSRRCAAENKPAMVGSSSVKGCHMLQQLMSCLSLCPGWYMLVTVPRQYCSEKVHKWHRQAYMSVKFTWWPLGSIVADYPPDL